MISKEIGERIYNQWLASLEKRGLMPKGTTKKFKIIQEEEELPLTKIIKMDYGTPAHLITPIYYKNPYQSHWPNIGDN